MLQPQTLLSELCINLEELVLLPFQGIREDSSFETAFFPCLVEMTHIRNHDPFFLSTVIVQHLRKTHHLVAVSRNFHHQTFAKDLSHLTMLAVVGCRLLLLAEEQTPKGFALTSRSCVNSGEVNCPASMVSLMSDATTVGPSSMSVVKLFFLEGRLIGVYSLEISIRSLG